MHGVADGRVLFADGHVMTLFRETGGHEQASRTSADDENIQRLSHETRTL